MKPYSFCNAVHLARLDGRALNGKIDRSDIGFDIIACITALIEADLAGNLYQGITADNYIFINFFINYFLWKGNSLVKGAGAVVKLSRAKLEAIVGLGLGLGQGNET